MANVELKFVCASDGDSCTLETKSGAGLVMISIFEQDRMNEIHLDIPTAIKFSKTLQAKIREIKGGSNV
ncbi:MAG: hypothetical protein HRT87_09520 [Legionellales bacterium]|nr:hypothetical protein [Legionellales bacterium]